MEGTELDAIKENSENFKCALQPPTTQQPHQGNQFLRAEKFSPPVPRLVGDAPRVPRVENKTPPTLRVETISL